MPNPTALSFGGVSDGLLSFYVSTAGHEAATNLTFNLNGGPESEGGATSVAINPTEESEGGATAGVVTATEGSSAGVLSQATSGAVQQVSQLLSLSGTTLDLAATLLTVSVVDIEAGGSTSATGGSTGPGQSPGSSQANGSSSDSGDEPSDETEQESPAIAERATAWERLVIGLERSWERARAVILELDGRSPAAEDRKGDGSARDWPNAHPARSDTRPTHNQRQDRVRRPGPLRRPRPRSSLPACRWEHRSCRDQRTPARPSMPRWKTWARMVTPMDRGDARASGLWDELAQARSSERTRALVTMVATAAAANAGWTLAEERDPATFGLDPTPLI